LATRRFGSIRDPEHGRGIPLRYLKDSIMDPSVRAGLAVSLGMTSFSK